MSETTDHDLKGQIRDHYAERAVQADEATAPVSCCGPGNSCCGGSAVEAQDELARGLYDITETSDLPDGAVLASLGCGNPTALADLQPGETVLDLGSGGGIDVLLSAKRVGPTGKAYGLDMTDEMLALARKNQEKAGATNVEFLKGEMETIPLPDASRRRHHQQLRHQPLAGQGQGPRRGVPCAQAGRPVRRLRRPLPGRHERRAR